MHSTVIKHDGHLRTRVFYISLVFSNTRSVLSQCNTRIRLLHLLYVMEVTKLKPIKHAFSMFYLSNRALFECLYSLI